jgi:hypothetical protein
MSARGLRTILLAASVAVIAGYVVLWAGVSPARQRGTDFSASYVAATLLRQGHADRLYDQDAEARAHAAILLPGTRADLPFITPPPTAILVVPLTFLDPETAFRVFSLVQLGLLTAACWLAARTAWPEAMPGRLTAGALAVAGTATLPLLLLGQWDGLCALGLAGAYAAWRRERPGLAGAVLVLGIASVKPHLGLGLAAFVLGSRDLRAIAGAAGAALLTVAASVLAAGAAATGAFLGATVLALGHTPAPSTLGLLGIASSWLGDGAAARVIAVAGGIAGVASAGYLGWRARGRRVLLEAGLAGAAALSLVVAPHLLAHDLVFLAPAFVWMCGRVGRGDAPRGWPAPRARAVIGAWFVLALLIALDAGAGDPAPPGRVVPLGLLAIGAFAVRQAHRCPDPAEPAA